MVVTTLGGIGLFLLGMILLIDGLKAVAGGALRRILTRTVSGPVSGLLSGAVVTSLVQSSTATSLTTIGFVSAGLLTFQQSVGVIFGANLGTTSTGWIVALLGVRVSITAAAMPMVAVGAALRLLGRDRVAAAGMAIAGFGLLFVGLDLLQQGMSNLAERFGPDDLPRAGGLWGRLLLLLIGVAMTVVMQSSSAAMATTLVALASGAVGLEQGAALVLGQNIGTTVTAGIAAVGASVPARRTAVAHVLFNIVAASLAFTLMGPMVAGALWLCERLFGDPQVIALALFQTCVKLLGISILLPLVSPFSRLVMRIVPQREGDLTRHLDSSVAQVGSVANEAMRRTVVAILSRIGAGLGRVLRAGGGRDAAAVEAIRSAEEALRKTAIFAASLGEGAQGRRERREYLGTLHALDHVTRLLEGIRDAAMLDDAASEPSLAPQRAAILAILGEVAAIGDSVEPPVAERIGLASASIASLRKSYRVETLGETAAGRLDPEASLRRLDASRALDRVGYHLWRASMHLAARPEVDAVEEGAVETGASTSP